MTRVKLSVFSNVLFLLFFISFIACGGGNGDDNGQNGGDNNGGNVNQNTGIIRGSVNSSSGVPLNAVHVRAVNLSDSDIQVAAFSGITSDLRIQNGFFEITNLPPGQYRVLIEKMDSRVRAFSPSRYSDFVISDNPSISFPDEYFNGQNESADDDPEDFTAVRVQPGQITGGINFITND